ncbi:hypothetical protein D3C80_2089430 [compost metagenome]
MQQQANKAVADTAKQAVTSATATVQQQASKAVTDTVKAAEQGDQARADAEAELEKLLN